MKLALIFLLSVFVVCADDRQRTPSPDPEPVQRGELPKMTIDIKTRAAMVPIFKKQCSGAVSITPIQSTAQYFLDTSGTMAKWRGTLYTADGEEVMTFKNTMLIQNFVRQVCDYFESLKGGGKERK